MSAKNQDGTAERNLHIIPPSWKKGQKNVPKKLKNADLAVGGQVKMMQKSGFGLGCLCSLCLRPGQGIGSKWAIFKRSGIRPFWNYRTAYAVPLKSGFTQLKRRLSVEYGKWQL